MKKRLLIIPAKKISKRIKNKNIKKFYGKPIISYSILNAIKSNLFSKIHVSTDSRKIKNISKNLGIKIDFMRPKNLCKSNVPIIDVMRHVVKKYEALGYKFDEVWNLSACSPLIKKSDLIKASKLFKRKKILISISKFNTPIEWGFKKNLSNKLRPINAKKLLEDSKKFKEHYYDTGNFAIFSNESLKRKNINLNNIFIGFEIPRHRAVDIDNKTDWDLAEKLYKIV